MQRSLVLATRVAVLALLIVLTGCMMSATPPPLLPTLTPTREPNLPTPTAVKVDLLPDVIEASKQLDQNKYEASVRLLTRSAAFYPEEEAISDMLAQAQMDWGKALISNAENPLIGYAQAIDHFSSGLAVVDSDDLRTQLEDEITVSKSYLWINTTTQALNQAIESGEVSSALLEQSRTMVDEVDRLVSARQGDMKIAALSSEALIASGRVLLLNDNLDSAQQAAQLCTRAVDLAGESKAARTCIDAAKKQTEPTPTPRPANTAPTVPKLEIPDIRGADVGRARDYLRNNIGFTGPILVSEVTDPSQIAGVCRQGVLYTSPGKGSRIPANAQIIIFYRGSTNAPGLMDCNAS